MRDMTNSVTASASSPAPMVRSTHPVVEGELLAPEWEGRVGIGPAQLGPGEAASFSCERPLSLIQDDSIAVVLKECAEFGILARPRPRRVDTSGDLQRPIPKALFDGHNMLVGHRGGMMGGRLVPFSRHRHTSIWMTVSSRKPCSMDVRASPA
ncbi:hypothetical protein BDV59DRAFT_155123 [Aspergillus ambiguus]|uniref:uncharacterized protein n=1 Tax=Aspergillus ambiguus TaxID=176160 RepID=UPI003CCCB269